MARMAEGLHDALTNELLQRVCSDFLEMPGLQLTARQAQRFWGLDETTCREVLDFLVDAKFLYLTAHRGYARSTDGRVSKPPVGRAGG